MKTSFRSRAAMAALPVVAVVLLLSNLGCQQQQRSTKVPQDATVLGQARGAPFTWTADRTGTLYVVDVPEDRVVHQGTLRTGQQVVVDPQVGRISVDGKVVSEGKFRSGHRNDVYLKSGAVTPQRPEQGDRVGETQ
jgi:hypothetical protein